MHADQAWIITAAVLTLTGVIGWLLHHYVEPVSWWPVVGRKWRAWYWAPSYFGGHTESPWSSAEGPEPMPEWMLDVTERTDEDWADELHVINRQVSHKVESGFQRRLVLVSEVTHYEIEAVIKDLGRADWLPERWKAAA